MIYFLFPFIQFHNKISKGLIQFYVTFLPKALFLGFSFRRNWEEYVYQHLRNTNKLSKSQEDLLKL